MQSTVLENPERDAVLIKVSPTRIALLQYPDSSVGRKETSLDILLVGERKAYSVFDPNRVKSDHVDAPAYWEKLPQ